jgi:hypothetical protein
MAKTDKYAKVRAAQEAGQKVGSATKPFEKGYKKGGSVKAKTKKNNGKK